MPREHDRSPRDEHHRDEHRENHHREEHHRDSHARSEPHREEHARQAWETHPPNHAAHPPESSSSTAGAGAHGAAPSQHSTSFSAARESSGGEVKKPRAGRTNKAHTATANRIARRYGGVFVQGEECDIVVGEMRIEVETSATIPQAIARLAHEPPPCYVAVTNKEALALALRYAAGTPVGVMDPFGEVVKEAGGAN